jgi:serine/threonine protein kinase
VDATRATPIGDAAAPLSFGCPAKPTVEASANVVDRDSLGCDNPVGAEWEVDPSEIRLDGLLGSGSTAEVFRGIWHGTDVAVKRLRHSGSLPKEFTREISVLVRLRHPNLVLFMGASTLASSPVIISEFCAGGTLFALLHQRRETVLPWSQRLKAAVDVAKGMNFLHRRQVIHRDLKSLNLLLASPVATREDVPQVKVSDFGLSRAWPTEQGRNQACMTSGAGTYHWMAPEVLDGHSYDEKVDVYSYGICLFELIARRIPYDTLGLEPVSIAVAVSRGRRPDPKCLPEDCPGDLRLTMECCWAQCPTGRPGFDTILETLKLVSCG